MTGIPGTKRTVCAGCSVRLEWTGVEQFRNWEIENSATFDPLVTFLDLSLQFGARFSHGERR
jgi:hypothetical protein